MKKTMRARSCCLALVAAASSLFFAPGEAHASLTASESAQVREFVNTAQPPNAARVRAIVARADLTPEESSQSLEAPLAAVMFNDTRAAFLRELVFGGASMASRSVLTTAVMRGVLARANEVVGKHPGDLDQHSDALAELQKIYAFIDLELAVTGGRRGFGSPPQTGISLATYDECARALGQHIAQHGRWLKPDTTLAIAAQKTRAQAELALVDLMNDGPTWRIDAADRLGLRGARRSFFTELGLLLLDSGKSDEARVERVRRVLMRLPAVRLDTSAVFFGEARPSLRARAAVIGVKTPLEGGREGMVEPFPAEAPPGAVDSAAADLALELAGLAVRRALDHRAELRLQAERDVHQAAADPKKLLGQLTEVNAESALAAAVRLLVLDSRRTIDLAFSRFLKGSPESAAMLSDALGVLAAFSDNGTPASGLTLALGRLEGEGGATDTTLATAVRLAPTGAVVGFTLSNHRWELTRGDTGVVTKVTQDGKELTLPMLSSAPHGPKALGAPGEGATKLPDRAKAAKP
jgi:hypothetical protein